MIERLAPRASRFWSTRRATTTRATRGDPADAEPLRDAPGCGALAGRCRTGERRPPPCASELDLEALLVTRSEEGMTLFSATGATHEPAVAREVYDVSGAGDTVIATLAVMLGAAACPCRRQCARPISPRAWWLASWVRRRAACKSCRLQSLGAIPKGACAPAGRDVGPSPQPPFRGRGAQAPPPGKMWAIPPTPFPGKGAIRMSGFCPPGC
jgi:hypothetical protein